jgi:alkylhydroperoxidase family enzyme
MHIKTSLPSINSFEKFQMCLDITSSPSMSRIPYRDGSVLPPGIPPLNLFRMMAHSPSTLPHILSLGTAVFRDTSLSPHLRELVCLLNAKRLSCEYQWKQHIPIAKQNSVTEDQIAALLADDITGERWTLEERALLAFLDQVICRPEVDEDVFVEARTHFSDQVLVEIVTMQVGICILTNSPA